MTGSDAKKVLALLSAAYPRQPISPETAGVWVHSIVTELPDVRFEDGVKAVQSLSANLKFFPALAELLAAFMEARWSRVESERQQVVPIASLMPENGRFLSREDMAWRFEWLKEAIRRKESAKASGSNRNLIEEWHTEAAARGIPA